MFLALLSCELLLVAVYVGNNLLDDPSATVGRLFDLDGEGNIPSWFSAMQLCVVALLCLALRSPGSGVPPVLATTAGLGLLAMSMDEAAGFHETVEDLVQSVEFVPRFHGDHGVWLFVYGALALGVLAFVYPHLRAFWRSHRRHSLVVLFGAGLFVSGGAGLEILSYEYLRDGDMPTLYSAEVVAEESLEMLGVSVVLRVFLELHAELTERVSLPGIPRDARHAARAPVRHEPFSSAWSPSTRASSPVE